MGVEQDKEGSAETFFVLLLKIGNSYEFRGVETHLT